VDHCAGAGVLGWRPGGKLMSESMLGPSTVMKTNLSVDVVSFV
jgi:hypothetical protein